MDYCCRRVEKKKQQKKNDRGKKKPNLRFVFTFIRQEAVNKRRIGKWAGEGEKR